MNVRNMIAVLLLTLGSAAAQQPAPATPLQTREQMLRDRVAAQQVSVQAASAGQEQPTVGLRPQLRPDKDSRRFVFTLTESDHGKRVNSRSFEMLSRERENSDMKTGSRIPVTSGNPKDFQYIDVGLNTNVEYYLRQDGKLDVTVSFEMSNVAAPTGESQVFTPPVLRQTRSNISAVITPDTPTVLDNVEDLSSGHTYELSVIAKPR